VLNGYRHAQGEYFINIDDDLQIPPEEALRILEHARMQELDVVYGNYIVKKHNLFRNAGSGFANLTEKLLLALPDSYYLSSCRCVSRLISEHIAVNSSPYI
jgi:glycosyltransferase involved in cell wall biosynthesis